MKISYLWLLTFILVNLNAMEPQFSTITLVSSGGKEFSVPRDAALQSGTIESALGFGQEQASQRVEFSVIETQKLQEIVDFMKVLHQHENLKGKALLDVLEKEVAVSDWGTFLEVAHFLDFKPAIEFAARSMVKNSYSQDDIISFAKRLENAAPELARYYFLINGTKLAGIPESSYGFSIKDYLVYRSEIIKQRRLEDGRKLLLGNLQLNSLEGLDAIPDLAKVMTLDLSNNHIENIKHGTFNEFTNVIGLNLSGNKLQEIGYEMFNGPVRLMTLDLKGNQITKILPGVFNKLIYLHRLDLNNNHITEIVPGVLNELRSLYLLNLSGNKITEIAPEALSGIEQLINLDVRGNQLSEQNIKQIRSVFPLPHTQITFEENQ